MRLLLDTHTFIWLDDDYAQLSVAAKSAIADTSNILVLSVASVWEMQIKVQLGNLNFTVPLAQKIFDQQQTNRLELLTVQLNHVFALNKLPDLHRDPFDRLLIAQAIAEGIPIISNDRLVSQYPVSVIW